MIVHKEFTEVKAAAYLIDAHDVDQVNCVFCQATDRLAAWI